jgi:hypothetical protein
VRIPGWRWLCRDLGMISMHGVYVSSRSGD